MNPEGSKPLIDENLAAEIKDERNVKEKSDNIKESTERRNEDTEEKDSKNQ